MPEQPDPKIKRELEPPALPTQETPPYAELDVVSNFSFLRGASHPDELVYRAAELGYRAIAIADVNTLAGVVRAHEAAKRAKIRLIIGARLRFRDGTPDVVVWCENREGYARVCKLLTRGKRRAPKGECWLGVEDLVEGVGGLWAGVDVRSECDDALRRLGSVFGRRLSLLACFNYGHDDLGHVARLHRLSRETGIPLLACNHVHYHDPNRRALQDVLTCVREKCTIHDAGYRLFPNAERYLKHPEQMHRLFREHRAALLRTMAVAEACTFSLEELRYEYPDEISPRGMSRTAYLRQLTYEGARERYPRGVPEKVGRLIEHELRLIEQLRIEPYFLTVYDLVKFARSRGILCQGRGSAANSAVCFCIGITSVDPNQIDLLFERFVSAARDEPPDIDVDFEHERREEVIQYVYGKYGRERCAMTAEVHTYRGRSAVRDVGKALGLGLDAVDRLAKRLDGWHGGVLSRQQIQEAGLEPDDPVIHQLIVLTTELLGFPRHLSQHVGGLVITRTPLDEMCPIENAAMQDRTVLEWDKDDIDAVGMLKVDCLALGMLTAIGKALSFVNAGNEAMRQLGNEGKAKQDGAHGADQESPGFDRVEAWQAVGASGVLNHAEDATGRVVRADIANEASGDLDSIQHRRGLCKADSPRLHQISENGERLPCRAFHAIRTGGGIGASRARSCHAKTDHRMPGGTPSPDHELGEEAVGPLFSPPSLPHCLIASLPAFRPLELHTIPWADSGVYDMICRADTIGVFQIESRAQMSMLPRLRPRCFYDLVIEVAIVRPGPIQGNMVHPYLRRRSGEEPVVYPSPELQAVLEKTLGVPLFQEQAMKVAMVAAGFSAEEADKLRRSMAAWRYNGAIETFRPRIVQGMLANGYTQEFAEQTFEQIKGFGEYGFPESHAASFALLVYASAWLKRYHPAAFCAALLNSQPMGFYAPAQLVRDAREHGVEVRPVDVNESEWDCTLEGGRGSGNEAMRQSGNEGKTGDSGASPSLPHCLIASLPDPLTASFHASSPPSTWGTKGPAVRLGFRMVKGLHQDHVVALLSARRRVGKFSSVEQLHRLTNLPRHVMTQLAEADAFTSLTLSRRPATWEALAAHSLTEMDREVEGRSDEATKRRSDEGKTGDERYEAADEPKSLTSSSALQPSYLLHSPSSLHRSVAPSLSPPPSPPSPPLPPMPLGQEVMLDYATTGLSLKTHPLALIRDQLTAEKVMPNRVALSRRGGSRVVVSGLVLVRQRPGTASGIVFMTLEDETSIVNLIIRPPIWERYRSAARHAGVLVAYGTLEKHGPPSHEVTHIMVYKLVDRSALLADYRLASRDFH